MTTNGAGRSHKERIGSFIEGTIIYVYNHYGVKLKKTTENSYFFIQRHRELVEKFIESHGKFWIEAHQKELAKRGANNQTVIDLSRGVIKRFKSFKLRQDDVPQFHILHDRREIGHLFLQIATCLSILAVESAKLGVKDPEFFVYKLMVDLWCLIYIRGFSMSLTDFWVQKSHPSTHLQRLPD